MLNHIHMGCMEWYTIECCDIIIKILGASYYRIAENVGGRKHWRIWQIDLRSAKFSPSKNPILILQILWRAEFTNVLYSKQSEELNLSMFSPTNVFRYTVIGKNLSCEREPGVISRIHIQWLWCIQCSLFSDDTSVGSVCRRWNLKYLN